MKLKSLYFFLTLLVISCNSNHNNLSYQEYAALSDEEKRAPNNALEGLDLLDDKLELTLFASEPMMKNPTNMDIDDRGRVWIVEGYNYRNKMNPNNPYNEKGDRVLILEDTSGDGKADKTTVFYQGEDINSALGIGVFGNKVIISRSPYVFVFTDENGDDIPEKKEILFEGIGGEEHDHGMHAFTFGPDGKFYFNYGNEGGSLINKYGKPVLDPWGTAINSNGKPYREGTVFRSDLEGENVEVLGWNFRNNFEVTVDSYGRLWQSDNDDDGNKAVRINYVMDYGNYGYKDEMTGEGWRSRRTNMNDSIPLKHWHLNDPGVVPNMLQTMAGSPTGILLYEGKLLPKKYQNQIIHSDPGPNIVRAYPITKSGSGFSATILNILDGSKRDNWFRPSDVTTAPDGSIFVSDWYDSGVGGHGMDDTNRGRIYRIAPKGHSYAVSAPKYNSIEDNINALQSPNVAKRYIAWNNLHDAGSEAEAALLALYNSSDARMRARALWLLSKIPNKGKEYILKAADDKNENIRITAIRASRELKEIDFSALYLNAAGDESSHVRREVALAIRHKSQPKVWQKLAEGYELGDRWYLEALGIAAEGLWDTYLPKYLEDQGYAWLENPTSKDIVWRSRGSRTLDLLGQLIAIETNDEKKWRYYRAMDFQEHSGKNSILLNLLTTSKSQKEQIIIFKLLDIDNLNDYPKLESKIASILETMPQEDFLDIIKKFGLKNQKERLLSIIRAKDSKFAGESAAIYMNFFGFDEIKELCIAANDEEANIDIERFGTIDTKPINDILVSTFQNQELSLERRRIAMRAMNGYNGEARLWEMIKNKKVPEDVMDIAKQLMLGTWIADIRELATNYFNENEEQEEIDIQKLLTVKGNPEKGYATFKTYCQTCHLVNEEGIDFGPGLSQIGSKLSKQGLFRAILYPSEGLGFGYETQLIKMKDGSEIQALISSKTESELAVKLMAQSELTVYDLANIESIEQLETSIMPKYPFSEEQLVNLVSYLESLK